MKKNSNFTKPITSAVPQLMFIHTHQKLSRPGIVPGYNIGLPCQCFTYQAIQMVTDYYVSLIILGNGRELQR